MWFCVYKLDDRDCRSLVLPNCPFWHQALALDQTSLILVMPREANETNIRVCSTIAHIFQSLQTHLITILQTKLPPNQPAPVQIPRRLPARLGLLFLVKDGNPAAVAAVRHPTPCCDDIGTGAGYRHRPTLRMQGWRNGEGACLQSTEQSKLSTYGARVGGDSTLAPPPLAARRKQQLTCKAA